MCAQTTLSVRGVTCAVIEDYHLQPFHCFVATSSKLVLLDLRQPSEPLLSVLHHLAEPPQWLVPFNHSGVITVMFLLSSILLSIYQCWLARLIAVCYFVSNLCLISQCC